MAVQRISEVYLKTCTQPASGQMLIYDDALTGFGVRLNPQSIIFFVEKKLGRNGKKLRRTIGPYPHYKVADARREAEVLIGELVKGFDRKAIERFSQIKTKTLGELLKEYLGSRKLKPKTAERYTYCLQTHLNAWIERPWIVVTSSIVKSRHAEITKESGPGSANYTFRAYSAVINYGMGVYRTEDDQPLISENPVLILGRTHSWNKLKPRTAYVRESELKQWWDGIEKLNNPDATDFFKVLILTGLRHGEAISLKWSNIDFGGRTLKVSQTKNGDPHILPLPAYLHSLLLRRKKTAASEFVFAGSGKHGHLVETKRSVNQAVKLTGIKFCCHDLRRSFATYADNLEINSNGLKRLLNHRSDSKDVTFKHYLPFNLERLREPMNKISNYILKAAGVIATAPVIPLKSPTTDTLKQTA